MPPRQPTERERNIRAQSRHREEVDRAADRHGRARDTFELRVSWNAA